MIDPLGEGVIVDPLEGATDAFLASKLLHAEQARHDGVARQGVNVGVAVLANEDRVDDGGEDFGFGGRVNAGVSQGAGIDELLPRVTHLQEVDEVSEESMASDRRGRLPASFDRAAKGVDAVGWGEVGGGGSRLTLRVKG